MLKPMFDRIIVKKLPEDGTSTGGIVLLGDAQGKYERGKVIAVGPGRRSQHDVLVTMTVKVGDKVMFDKGIGAPLRVDQEEVLMMFEGDVIGIIG